MRSITLVTATLALFLGAATPANALFDGSLAASRCIAGKVKCITKKKSCLLNCHRKALSAGVAVDDACVAKCKDKFDGSPAVPGKGCFAKLEAKGGCGASVGDAASFEARIDAHVQEIVGQLVPNGGAQLNECTAGKLGCVRKYNACVLGLVRKAAQKGTPIGDVAKCTRILDSSSGSCIGKLETKYCNPSDVGCSSTATPCLTLDDEGRLRLQDDAFVDDAIVALESGDMNTQRCNGDTSVQCTSAPGGVAGCGGGLGTCEFYFGAPLPQAAAGISTCQTFQWDGAISGTFDQATGASTGTAAIIWRVYGPHFGPDFDEPCPRCDGDGLPNDGLDEGVCNSGPQAGSSCDGNRLSPYPSFGGTTSLDCPPTVGSLVASIPIDLSNTNDGMLTKTLGPGSPTCNGAPGKLCLCGSCSLDASRPCENDAQCATAAAGTCTNAAGEPRRPSACIDTTTVVGDGTLCVSTGGGEGVCPEGPVDQHCVIETFRGCVAPSDCPTPGDSCGASPRKCFPDYNGDLGDSISAAGSHDEPRNGAAVMTFGALSCLAPTDVSAVNSFNGFPGPARLQLTGIGQDNGGPGCPTQASFLPTSKGNVLEVGWTGFGHDNTLMGQAKLTVAATCTGLHPTCSCSYAGPIQNPNAP